jgi:hypothetical protein
MMVKAELKKPQSKISWEQFRETLTAFPESRDMPWCAPAVILLTVLL